MKKINWKVLLITLGIILAVILLSVMVVQTTMNGAISREEQVNTAVSDIKVQEKRRVDLLYNLVDTVQAYSEYEAETLTTIIEARGDGAAANIENASMAISAVAEQYPQLQANEDYKQLMTELALTENMIAEYRSNYNVQVRSYNRYVRKFPGRVFLNWAGYEVVTYDYLDYQAPVDAPQNLFD